MTLHRRSIEARVANAHHPDKIAVARALRQSMTPAERAIWAMLRANTLGVRRRRQHVLNGFILDFYCPRLGMVLEVDGPVHDSLVAEDEAREIALAELGLFIVRVRNRDALHHLDDVVRQLRAIIDPIVPRRR